MRRTQICHLPLDPAAPPGLLTLYVAPAPSEQEQEPVCYLRTEAGLVVTLHWPNSAKNQLQARFNPDQTDRTPMTINDSCMAHLALASYCHALPLAAPTASIGIGTWLLNCLSNRHAPVLRIRNWHVVGNTVALRRWSPDGKFTIKVSYNSKTKDWQIQSLSRSGAALEAAPPFIQTALETMPPWFKMHTLTDCQAIVELALALQMQSTPVITLCYGQRPSQRPTPLP